MAAARPAADRCVLRSRGLRVSTTAAIHVGKGGFSMRSTPFIVGTSQLPSATISRAVTIFRVSMMSVGRELLLIKNAAKQRNSSQIVSSLRRLEIFMLDKS